MESHVGLGHRRLSIVDLAMGHQPMANEDGTVWIVFNGEIYNHGQFRPSLEAAGHRFRTHSDTEAIVHLYESAPHGFPRDLRGMFAFAIWDSQRERLLLARDHSGIKPLYFARIGDGSIVFGSEVKSLFASGLLDPEINVDVLEEYFATGHTSGGRTLYRNVEMLPPGHTLTWQNGEITIAPYWTAGRLPTSAGEWATPEAAAPEFWRRFLEAVESQLMSDVPLGVFLSGGLDSSLLVAAMIRCGVQRVQSFSVGYKEAEASELPVARLVAARLGTEHHEIIVDGSDFFGDLPDLTWQRDLPLTFSASIPLYHVSKLAREHVTVVLTGEGSDELFAGYGRYPRALLNHAMARRAVGLVSAELLGSISALASRGGASYLGSRVARSFLANPATPAGTMLEPFADWFGADRAALFASDVPTGAPFGNVGALLPTSDVTAAPLEALLRYDQHTYLDELLMKQDTMSMAASLESRVPFLDHHLVEWAGQLPASAKLSGRTGKALVRIAARQHLPHEVYDGPKRGFLVPLDRWLRTVGRHSLAEFLPGADDELFNVKTIERIQSEHQRGRNHTGRLWRLLAFQVWRRTVLPRLSEISRVARRRDATSPTSLSSTK
jgi:asparagine synthase (glutamine-hydrolysing)